MKNDNLSGKKPKIAVCGVGSRGAEALSIAREKMNVGDYDFDKIKFIPIGNLGFSPYICADPLSYPLFKDCVRPRGFEQYSRQLRKEGKILSRFGYAVILCDISECRIWARLCADSFYALDAAKCAKDAGCAPFIIFFQTYESYPKRNTKEIKDVLNTFKREKISYCLVKPDKSSSENIHSINPDEKFYNKAANKAIETVRQICETGKIEP